jgi:diguanylate cyclase (GGDEF)-like protein/PAS domain S-box-containing protein
MLSASDILNACILIVDDQVINIRTLDTILRGVGYTQLTATTDPTQVCALHRTNHYDLILLDLLMPGMDGFAVMDGLREIEKDGYLPVLVITAQPDHKLRALQAGARDFITKPFDLTEVQTRIHNMLEVRLLYKQILEGRLLELQRFRSAMDATGDAIFLVDPAAMRLVDVNETACRLLGYTRTELLNLGPPGLGVGTHEELAETYGALIAGEGHGLIEAQLRRKDGSWLAVELFRRAQRSGDGWIIVSVARDITERIEAQQRLQQLAHFDPLTGMPNRTLFYQMLQKAVRDAAEIHWLLAVLFIDLDQFKKVNDTLGHVIGDELLRQFGNRLTQCVRVGDTVGRLGGDEFALVLMLEDDQQGAVAVAGKIRDILREPFDLDGHETAVTASIGITVFPADAGDPETLIKYADTAMFQAKEAGRDTYRFFTPGMNARVLARLDMENALRKALENEELILYYQPKVRVDTGRITGVEALLRWNRPGYGLVSPAEFIPVLEESGMIVPVGAWVINEACRQIAVWRQSPAGATQISVNVSGRQFAEASLEEAVVEAIERHRIEADFLELEITESSLMSNAQRTVAVLHNLKALGIQISVDDFGTGYSSLAYLKRFPIDKLKIDIAFIRDVTTNPDDAAIALAIIRMAHSLKLEVVAEGVENQMQLAFLQRHHCDHMQGYYFSRPVPVHELEQMLREEKSLPLSFDGDASEQQTILLIDDDPSVLSALQRLLRQDGYRILTAASAAEGFEQLALHQVQVIVCDQRMPVMTGTEFFDKVKDLYPDTFRIVLSGYSDLASIMEAINSGAIFRFYSKPWDSQALREHVRTAFAYTKHVRRGMPVPNSAGIAAAHQQER